VHREHLNASLSFYKQTSLCYGRLLAANTAMKELQIVQARLLTPPDASSEPCIPIHQF